MRGAQPLAAYHGLKRVGSFGGTGCQSVRVLTLRLLSEQL